MTSRGNRTSPQWARNSASSLTSPSRRRAHPVAAGFEPPTRNPLARNQWAIAPAIMVFPTPVSVPVTNNPEIPTARKGSDIVTDDMAADHAMIVRAEQLAKTGSGDRIFLALPGGSGT